jgi:hypothetical protein
MGKFLGQFSESGTIARLGRNHHPASLQIPIVSAYSQTAGPEGSAPRGPSNGDDDYQKKTSHPPRRLVNFGKHSSPRPGSGFQVQDSQILCLRRLGSRPLNPPFPPSMEMTFRFLGLFPHGRSIFPLNRRPISAASGTDVDL